MSDGNKVPERDLSNPLALGNAVFLPADGTLRLFGLRNETVAFQVVVEGGEQPSDEVTIEFDRVGAIANQTATDLSEQYFLGRHIEIFEERRVAVRFRSHDLMWRPNTDAAPNVALGRIADPLVPHRSPVRVAAATNQVFWVDVWIPRDAVAETHRGTLWVKQADRVVATLAVVLEVGDATLPEVAHSKTMVWFSAGSLDGKYAFDRYLPRAQQTPAALRRLRRLHYQLARRHRLTLFWGKHKQPNEEWAEQLSGHTYSHQQGYAGPGQDRGDDVAVLAAYGGQLAPGQGQTWQHWLGGFPDVQDAFLYVMDEPSLHPRNIAYINEIARVAKPVQSFVTARFHPWLSIDIFAAPAQEFSRVMVEAAQKSGRPVWIYNGVRPFTGTLAIDDVAISPRVNPWLQYREQIPRWFYWEATYYFDFQGDRGPVDVWREAHNFSNRNGDRVNGDGLLMYPGTDLLFPGSAPGVDRPLPSIRLKNWRRGIEDVEYLHLASARGHENLVNEVVAALVPSSFQERREDEPVSWPEDGERWLRARRLLFDAIVGNPTSVSVAALRRLTESRRAIVARKWSRVRSFLWGSDKRRAATSGTALLCFLIVIRCFLRRRKV